jgi:ribosome recycling factor
MRARSFAARIVRTAQQPLWRHVALPLEASLADAPSSRRSFAKKKKRGKKAAAPASGGGAVDEEAPPPPSFEDEGGDEADAFDASVIRAGMEKVLGFQTSELGKLRPGRAEASMFDHIQVEAYGERMPLPGVGQAVLKGPRLLVVTPFDPSLAPSIKAALESAGLSLNAEIEGNSVKVPIVKTTKESREALAKVASGQLETTRQQLRRLRQKALQQVKGGTANGVSEDEVYSQQKEVQELTDEFTAKATTLVEAKVTEVMSP